jgi:uncharacterized protein
LSSTLEQTDRFLSLILANRWNAAILERIPRLALTDWWLTAGCLAQSVWNGVYNRAPDQGILDYDVFYFDPDTGWAGEDAVIRSAAVLFADLPITVQIRNQARVPLWYEEKFGVAFPPVRAASDGIDQFPCGSVAIGVRRVGDEFKIHAPFGLAPVLCGELIPNPALPIPEVYVAKTERWCGVWPDLKVRAWPAQRASGSAKPSGAEANFASAPPKRMV